MVFSQTWLPTSLAIHRQQNYKLLYNTLRSLMLFSISLKAMLLLRLCAVKLNNSDMFFYSCLHEIPVLGSQF